nr:hypothetical protein [Pseudoclavibacter sp. Marseille-Q3772]
MTSQYPSNPQRPEHNQYGQYGQSGSGYPPYNGATNHQQSAHHQQPAQRKANIPGVIAVVIAALAILFSFVPMLGIVAIVPSLIAICLGIAGVASSTYRANRGWAVAGIERLSASSCLVMRSWTYSVGKIKDDISDAPTRSEAPSTPSERDDNNDPASPGSETPGTLSAPASPKHRHPGSPPKASPLGPNCLTFHPHKTNNRTYPSKLRQFRTLPPPPSQHL